MQLTYYVCSDRDFEPVPHGLESQLAWWRFDSHFSYPGKTYANLEEIYDALINRQVKGILIDAFTAGSRAELFNRTDIRINKLYDYSAAYGVVLGGESKKLQKCFDTYLSEQRSYVSDIIQRNTQAIKVGMHTVMSLDWKYTHFLFIIVVHIHS